MGHKLVIAVRTDLNMGKGKIAAQVGHASVKAALAAKAGDRRAFESWMDSGQPKVVVKVGGIKELEDLVSEAARRGIGVHPISDAGRTQIASGTRTCAAFGPADEGVLDTITGHLKLL